MVKNHADKIIRAPDKKSKSSYLLSQATDRHKGRIVSKDHSNKQIKGSTDKRIKKGKNRNLITGEEKDRTTLKNKQRRLQDEKRAKDKRLGTKQDQDSAKGEKTYNSIDALKRNERLKQQRDKKDKEGKDKTRESVGERTESDNDSSSNLDKETTDHDSRSAGKKSSLSGRRSILDRTATVAFDVLTDEMMDAAGVSDSNGVREAKQLRRGAKKGAAAYRKTRWGITRLKKTSRTVKQSATRTVAYARALASKQTVKLIVAKAAAPAAAIMMILALAATVVAGASFLSFGTGDCETQATSTNITSKSQEENAKAIYDFVMTNVPGATPQGVVGMIGNFHQESQMDPAAIEDRSKPLSGHGIAQWTRDRTTNLKNFAKEKGKEWSDLGLQLDFLLYELNGSEKASVAALKMTNVEEATAAWQTLFERAGVPAMGNRLAFANEWYAKLKDTDPMSSSAMSTAADGELGSLLCGEGGDGGEILDVAKGWLGWFYYVQAHPSPDLGDLNNPNKSGGTDCSGFVWLVLNKAGYNVPPGMQWYTGSMASDAKGSKQYLKQISESEAEAGDIVIVNLGAGLSDDGHTAILVEKWHGLETKIIEEGGGKDSVSYGQVNTSFGYLLNGGDVTLARPIKKGAPVD
ncbi:phage tail tip lysozyme [Enterococcus pallens]|uniref:NlpC/P60 domain-containing protein n=1 Tax=Enterococcus pallens ATCC BAA-351 TaxID=1158607 RepID=R2PP22_9ENTE|nr:phage tail tip lysozyme [Enterococcus pallens]EOH86282.1 hypothetical protein UAU_05303 [Enterococcus pallens ATCC BAA-351]EOU09394.1 hypothetical protein I588_05240 [Enterococcus pallens ATCC BAA-351]OJG76434.1 hypothetical protein RV10_GL003762 [Enterococcus pallens]